MPQRYDESFKKNIVRLRVEEGRTLKSLTTEYGISKTCIGKWCSEFREECQKNPQNLKEYNAMKEISRLRKELEDLRKENLF